MKTENMKISSLGIVCTPVSAWLRLFFVKMNMWIILQQNYFDYIMKIYYVFPGGRICRRLNY